MKAKNIYKKYAKGDKNARLKVLSLGVGVQSTALYLMSSMGYKVPRADVAIFSDPGAESLDTYKTLKWLQKWKKQNNGIPIVVNNEKNLYKDIIEQVNTDKKIPSMPLHLDSGVLALRQCTGRYKIEPVMKSTRALHNLKPRQRMLPTEMWLGISLDEIERMKESTAYNVKYFYPLIYHSMTRKDCIDFFKNNDFPVPAKSGCVFCPYTSNKTWSKLKKNNPEDFKIAVKADKALRNIPDKIKGWEGRKMYIHKSCVPLEDIDFGDTQLEMFEGYDCEGYCGL